MWRSRAVGTRRASSASATSCPCAHVSMSRAETKDSAPMGGPNHGTRAPSGRARAAVTMARAAGAPPAQELGARHGPPATQMLLHGVAPGQSDGRPCRKRQPGLSWPRQRHRRNTPDGSPGPGRPTPGPASGAPSRTRRGRPRERRDRGARPRRSSRRSDSEVGRGATEVKLRPRRLPVQ